MSKFYFGCVAMDETDAQCKELRRTCEKPLTRKLGLGRNFPRKRLYGIVTAIYVGIVAAKTAIEVLTLKFYFSHKRLNSKNGKC